MHLHRRVLGPGLIALASLLSPVAAQADAEKAPPPAAAAPAVDDRARFTATFRYAGDEREAAARKAAIDRGVSTFFFAIRGIARSRLSDGTKIDPSVSFSFDPGKIRVRIPNSTDAVSPDNGTPVDHGTGGDKSKLSQKLTAGKLTQVFVASEGGRTNEWSLTPDGNTLLLRVTVSSPKLSNPVIYALTYKKAP
jgi:hypothetical protein